MDMWEVKTGQKVRRAREMIRKKGFKLKKKEKREILIESRYR